jgi:fatty acid synthase subunit alpha
LKSDGSQHDNYFASRVSDIEKEAKRQEMDALAMYGMLEGIDSLIAPKRRALAIRGRTANDIGAPSVHGTSTGATAISHAQGNTVPIVEQKSSPAHSKGGSASWQMMGLLQSVNTGSIPGNRNGEYVLSFPYQSHS